MDLLGMAKAPVGLAVSLGELLSDLLNLIPGSDVQPSSWLQDKMDDENTYRVSRLFVGDLAGIFKKNVTGIRFMVTVDENNCLQPEFFVRSKNGSGQIVGVEIGLDRKAIATSGLGSLP